MSSTANRLQQFIGEVRREGRSKTCFAADGNCSSTIVKAHSIQNNRILTRLADNGEVIQLKHDIRKEEFEIAPMLVGRRVASVATNFCGMHDANIFLPIEQHNYTPGDFQQEFLFAYRAYAREYHVKLEQAIMFKYALKKLDTTSGKEVIADGLQGTEIALKEMEPYRTIFNQARQRSDFTQIHTYRAEFRLPCPIAASSSFALEHDLNDRLVNDLGDLNTSLKPLMLTAFPQDTKTHVLISCFRKDKKDYACIPKQILSRTKAEQKIIISNIILAHVENLFVSPSWWESKPKSTQASILNRFSETIASDGQALSNMLCINLLE
jgi:hypothetical protein